MCCVICMCSALCVCSVVCAVLYDVCAVLGVGGCLQCACVQACAHVTLFGSLDACMCVCMLVGITHVCPCLHSPCTAGHSLLDTIDDQCPSTSLRCGWGSVRCWAHCIEGFPSQELNMQAEMGTVSVRWALPFFPVSHPNQYAFCAVCRYTSWLYWTGLWGSSCSPSGG